MMRPSSPVDPAVDHAACFRAAVIRYKHPDGDFWHGNHWEDRRAKLAKGYNGDYWIAKIEYNMRRDREVTAELEAEGWKVLRVWEEMILTDPDNVVQLVANLLGEPGEDL